jgi:ABC-type molybdate transport system substrate-binding protein
MKVMVLILAFVFGISKAQVKIRGNKPGETVTIHGEPVLFARTVPKNFTDQKLAVSWVDFLLSDKGIDIMKRMGMNPVIPAITNDASKVPAPLVRYL